MMRRSTRLANKSSVAYTVKKTYRKRCRITLTVTVANYEKGGTMPNVYGEQILQGGTAKGEHDLSIVKDIFTRAEGVLTQPSPGAGYIAITNDLFHAITNCQLMR